MKNTFLQPTTTQLLAIGFISCLSSCIITTRPVAYEPPPPPAPVVVAQPAPPPAWVPAYEYATPSRYYYLPEIQTYYDASTQQFVYFNGGVWQQTPYLPPAYASYNLNAGYVVVLQNNVTTPWVNHSYYVNNYPQNQPASYQGPRGFNENSRQPIYNNSGNSGSPAVNPTPATRNPGVANPNGPAVNPTPATRNPGYAAPSQPSVNPTPAVRGATPSVPQNTPSAVPSQRGAAAEPAPSNNNYRRSEPSERTKEVPAENRSATPNERSSKSPANEQSGQHLNKSGNSPRNEAKAPKRSNSYSASPAPKAKRQGER